MSNARFRAGRLAGFVACVVIALAAESLAQVCSAGVRCEGGACVAMCSRTVTDFTKLCVNSHCDTTTGLCTESGAGTVCVPLPICCQLDGRCSNRSPERCSVIAGTTVVGECKADGRCRVP